MNNTANAFEIAGENAQEELSKVIQFPTRVSGAKPTQKTEPAEWWNQAEMLGEWSPEFELMLDQDATLTTGSFFKVKDRRNTQDGQWEGHAKTWRDWLEGNQSQRWGLTRHFEDRQKVGSVYVYASTVEKARTAKSVDQIFAMALDFDSGTKLDDILDRIEDLGLFAIVSTSHSHGKDTFEIARDEVVKALGASETYSDEQIQVFLREHSKQHYDSEFIDSVTISEQNKRTKTGSQIVVTSAPLEKFRVVFPLAAPVGMAALGDTDKEALNTFESKIIGLAVNMLEGHPDVSATDPCRMMYAPRHPKGAEFYAAVVQGRPLTFDEIPTHDKRDYVKSRKASENAFTVAGEGSHTDQLLTPRGQNLKAVWHDIKDRLMIADLIESECPEYLREDPGKTGWIHIECPFQAEHGTIDENDTATFVINALDSSTSNFSGKCHHDACKSQDRGGLELLHGMLHEGWFDEDLLNDDSPYILEPGEEVTDTRVQDYVSDTTADAVRYSEFEPVKDWLPSKKYKSDGLIISAIEEKATVPVCTAFNLVGGASNAAGDDDDGIIISFKNRYGVTVEKTLMRGEIAVEGKLVIKELTAAGMVIYGHGTKANARVLELLQRIQVKRQIPTVNVPGWVRNEHGDIAGFMHPTGVYDRVSGNPFRLLEGSRVEVVKSKGSLEGWIRGAEEALKYADSNFYWPLGLVAGFAGPLLGILDWPPCGFSLSGLTSKGKTMAQIMGATVWGSPMAGRGLLFTANTTGNAMEDLSVRGTDSFLGLDEIGAMSDRKALSGILFALSTGRTKSRKKGRERGLTQGDSFRPFVLLSSEKGMRNEIQAAGDSYRGGLAVRFPDIDVSDGVTIDGAALTRLDVVKENYGHAGSAFIRYLIDSGIDRDQLEREVLAIATRLAIGKSSAMARAARVFAVTQRGGELAAQAGLLGDVETAQKAIRTAVQGAWDTFTQSDEAGAATGGEALLDKLRSFLFGELNRRIVVMDNLTEVSDGHANARGDVIGWADGGVIYLDSSKVHDPAKLGLDIGSRNELVNQLAKLGVLIEPSGKGATFRQLPKELAPGSENGAAVRNIRLCRKTLDI